jgi:hypothetical protein
MTHPIRHQELEDSFRELVSRAGLPEPDDVAHLRRVLIFLWYETKAFLLLDLDEMPKDEDPFAALDLDMLHADVLGEPLEPAALFGRLGMTPPGFAETG